MRRQVRTLNHVNYLVRLAGYSEPFSSKDLRYDPDQRTLIVKTEMGAISFTEHDEFTVDILDLEVPTVLRNQMKDSGWECSMPIQDFIDRLHLESLTD